MRKHHKEKQKIASKLDIREVLRLASNAAGMGVSADPVTIKEDTEEDMEGGIEKDIKEDSEGQ